jgi:hypothetical protein
LIGRPFTIAATSAGAELLQLVKARHPKAIAAAAAARIVFINDSSL